LNCLTCFLDFIYFPVFTPPLPPITQTGIERCSNCGVIFHKITPKKEKQPIHSAQNISSTQVKNVKCPKCGSTELTSQKRGYSIAKGLTIGALSFPVSLGLGLLGGLHGRKKIDVTCLKCGHKWSP